MVELQINSKWYLTDKNKRSCRFCDKCNTPIIKSNYNGLICAVAKKVNQVIGRYLCIRCAKKYQFIRLTEEQLKSFEQIFEVYAKPIEITVP